MSELMISGIIILLSVLKGIPHWCSQYVMLPGAEWWDTLQFSPEPQKQVD